MAERDRSDVRRSERKIAGFGHAPSLNCGDDVSARLAWLEERVSELEAAQARRRGKSRQRRSQRVCRVLN